MKNVLHLAVVASMKREDVQTAELIEIEVHL